MMLGILVLGQAHKCGRAKSVYIYLDNIPAPSGGAIFIG
jgi:hypothetical protein